jgi:hypothetical protein
MEKIQKAAGMLSTLKDLTSVHTCDLFVGYFSQPHKDGTRTANGTDAWESPGLETKDLWWWNPDRESYARYRLYLRLFLFVFSISTGSRVSFSC